MKEKYPALLTNNNEKYFEHNEAGIFLIPPMLESIRVLAEKHGAILKYETEVA